MNSSAKQNGAAVFAATAAKVAAQTRCHDVVLLDVGGLSPVADYFIIASGTSARQMRTVADDIIEAAAAHGYRPLSSAGRETGSWILIDFVDVVVHIFTDETRRFYDLENLWGDGKKIDWEKAAQ